MIESIKSSIGPKIPKIELAWKLSLEYENFTDIPKKFKAFVFKKPDQEQSFVQISYQLFPENQPIIYWNDFILLFNKPKREFLGLGGNAYSIDLTKTDEKIKKSDMQIRDFIREERLQHPFKAILSVECQNKSDHLREMEDITPDSFYESKYLVVRNRELVEG